MARQKKLHKSVDMYFQEPGGQSPEEQEKILAGIFEPMMAKK